MGIQLLSEVVAAQIAAGEVIERPASVVKELVENALDADASSIQIEVTDGGRKLIRVSDDGLGIPATEVELAFARHATSKVRAIEDLNRIHTLGFRGEALHSIAAISRVTLTTQHQQEDSGVQLHIEGGKLRDRRSVGAPTGTVILVEDLFYNTPARLKFLKGVTSERRRITAMIVNYAIAYPQVRFSLRHDGREVLVTYGSGDLAEVLVTALGLETFRDMLAVESVPSSRPDQAMIQVSGYASLPSRNRANRSHITLFVNGRPIQDSSLAYAVSQVYQRLMPQGRYPIAILLITMPTDEVDVNVHPTKAEVRFRSPDAVFAAVQRAVQRALADQMPALAIPESALRGSEADWRQPRQMLFGDADLDESGSLDPAAAGLSSNAMPGRLDDEALTAIPDGAGQPVRPRSLPPLRVLGQVGGMYIVAEGPAGLYLVDQHAAHCRVLYEQFLAERQAGRSITRQVFDAVTLELPARMEALVEAHRDVLAQIGIDLAPFGRATFQIRSLPAVLADRDPRDAVRALMQHLQDATPTSAGIPEERILSSLSRAAAIKGGQVLSLSEMQALLRQLERCSVPHTDPQGQPTMIHLSSEQLAHQFGRT